MALKRCLQCPRLTSGSRCPEHTRAKDRQRGSTAERGYDSTHQRLRAELVANLDPLAPCPKCGHPLGSNPSLLDLGHIEDRQGWTGLEHREHNRATARKRR